MHRAMIIKKEYSVVFLGDATIDPPGINTLLLYDERTICQHARCIT